MTTVYIDNNYMCHTERKDGYREAQHEFFDNVPVEAVRFYKFIPERNFIQCVDVLGAMWQDCTTEEATAEDYEQALAELGVK